MHVHYVEKQLQFITGKVQTMTARFINNTTKAITVVQMHNIT